MKKKGLFFNKFSNFFIIGYLSTNIFTLLSSRMKQKKQIVIFTDLDGSLLNKDTFRFEINC